MRRGSGASRGRFFDKVVKDPGGCWLWVGAAKGKGYGSFRFEGRPQAAHRAAYKLLVGSIPDGLQLDHLCRNTLCVNPDHLEPVTNAENCRRGATGAHNSSKTHCPQGHPYDAENTGWRRAASQ